MEIQNRKSVTDKPKKYCYLSNGDDDFIEVTRWVNSEGIDITINSNRQEKSFSLTYGELEAINYLKMSLDYQK